MILRHFGLFVGGLGGFKGPGALVGCYAGFLGDICHCVCDLGGSRGYVALLGGYA